MSPKEARRENNIKRSPVQALPRQRNKRRSCCANEIADYTYIVLPLFLLKLQYDVVDKVCVRHVMDLVFCVVHFPAGIGAVE